MDQLPTVAAPGVGARAADVAVSACHLHDAVGTGKGAWSQEAAEDAIEAVETTALALGTLRPEAPAVLAPVHAALAELRRRLGLRHQELLSGTEALPAPRGPVSNPRRSRLSR
ncbi:hypothetical protein [Streptomyces sp. NPDC089919]|uniref:hypothetical protein n=1 Tax=Streptomyces sp. NPDC089919 TaxID=3155188 RepID=UPI003427AA0B